MYALIYGDKSIIIKTNNYNMQSNKMIFFFLEILPNQTKKVFKMMRK